MYEGHSFIILWQTSCLLEELLSICRTSNPLLQSVVLPNPASCQNQSPRLQANHLAESARCGVLPKTYSYSVLCLVRICFPSFLILRGWTGNTEYFRVRIPDIQFFIDHQCFRLFLRKHNFILIYRLSCRTINIIHDIFADIRIFLIYLWRRTDEPQVSRVPFKQG